MRYRKQLCIARLLNFCVSQPAFHVLLALDGTRMHAAVSGRVDEEMARSMLIRL